METHNFKLEHANVVATFDSQDDVEEAVLGLRIAGFRDSQIGYLARNQAGLVTDYLGGTFLLAGTIVGLIVGAMIGTWAGQQAIVERATPFGPAFLPGDQGFLLTFAICGAITGGIIGAVTGWGIPRAQTVHMGTEIESGVYVLAVNAGERKDEVWAILRRHGGYVPSPADSRARPVSHRPGEFVA